MLVSGDSTLITTKTGKVILLDGGEDRNILLTYLLCKRVKKIDYVLISHFDTDHYSGLIDVLGKVKISNIIISKQIEENINFEDFMKQVYDYNIKIITAKAGDRIVIDKYTNVDILWPEKVTNRGNNLNNNSIVAKINYGKASILFTGDIEEEVEQIIIKKYSSNTLKSDVLKVSHHGADTSSSLQFIETVKPVVALIGVGKNNKFGHPKLEVIDRLKKEKVNIYRTDLYGEITLNIDQKRKYKDKNFYIKA